MNNSTGINSESYWDSRFDGNWESCQGPEQSRFFASLAIKNLPGWLISQIRKESLTLVDWGCAQGDGTDVWAGYIDTKQLAGVDISMIAVEQASHRYPSIRFLTEDWLSENYVQQEVFDVVFSSNTLEHFHTPYDTLQVLLPHARKAIVLALPYRELTRHHEHFFTFLPDNIPLVLPGGFRLVWSQVADCSQIPSAFWGGDQIILIYADPAWVDGIGLTLRDVRIEQDDSSTKICRLDTQVNAFAREVAEKDRSSRELSSEVQHLTEELQLERNKTLWQHIKEKGYRKWIRRSV
jgi:hypothetical protein